MSAARPDTWIALDIFNPLAAPERPGVYVVICNGKVVYVGQSNNLRARLTRHQIRPGYARNIITPWGTFPDPWAWSCKAKVSRRIGDWAMWEIRLIHRLRPMFNKTFSGARWKAIANG